MTPYRRPLDLTHSEMHKFRHAIEKSREITVKQLAGLMVAKDESKIDISRYNHSVKQFVLVNEGLEKRKQVVRL
jgi:hypothetical protein